MRQCSISADMFFAVDEDFGYSVDIWPDDAFAKKMKS